MPRNYLPDEPEYPEDYQNYYEVHEEKSGLGLWALMGVLSAILVFVSFFSFCWLWDCPSPINSTTKSRVPLERVE